MLLFAAGGLLLAGTASTAMSIIFPWSSLSWSICETKLRTDQTNFNQLAPPCWRNAIETRSRQTLALDLDGCTGRLRACPFLGGRRALLRGRFVWDAAMVSETGAFLLDGGLQHHFQEKDTRSDTPYILAADLDFPKARTTTGSGDGTRL